MNKVESMSTLTQRVENRLRDRIRQMEQRADQPLPAGLFDPLFEHLDALIAIVASTQNFSTEPYLGKVREVVCVQCAQNPDGHCVRRDTQTCGLDAYFPTIVATIEKELRNDPGLSD